MREVEERAARAFVERFGAEPEVVTSAPGRVNMIGEHTDYNGGFVLPCAIDRRIAVAASRSSDGGELYSADFDEARTGDEKDGSWADYPRGVAWAMREFGREVEPFRAAFAGDVPRGSGLSSSAAIEAATVLALAELSGISLDRKEAAVMCRRAENDYVGVQTGIMDQYASLLCESGHALLIDCRTLDAERVPLDLSEPGLTLLVCDTCVERGLASTGYNERREQCERAARELGVEELRDASEEDLEVLSGVELKRARHVVLENARVVEAVDALRSGNYAKFGRLMYASHVSLRDDYEVSTRELDTFVELAEEAGAPGARLTGAGFGGCAIALAPDAAALSGSVRREFAGRGFDEPDFYEFLPSSGAEVSR
jgi:galactokinase